MATKKKVSEKKVEKSTFLAVSTNSNDYEYFSSFIDFVLKYLDDGWDGGDIIDGFTIFTIKDGEICEVEDLAIDIPEVVPKITFKV